MTSIRNCLAVSALTAGALLTAGGLITAATAADSPPAATAAPDAHAGWHHGHHGHRGGFFYARLGLTDDQKAQMKTMHQAAEPQMKTLLEQMRSNSAKLKTLAPNDPQYLATVKEVSEANAPIKAQLEQQRAALHQKIYTSVLTPSQQTQLLQMKAQWEQREQERTHAGTAS